MIRRLLPVLAVLWAVPWSARAQDVTFQASVDRSTVALGEQFTLTFTLGNAAAGGGKDLKLPDLGKFHIMSGPNQASSMSFINGAVSSSVSYSYVLQPKEVGKFTIGPATIDVNAQVLKSSPVAVEVVAGGGRGSQAGAPPPSDLAAQVGDNLILKATVDRTRVQQGEQINLVFRLYVGRVSVLSYGIDKAPTYTGFWGEEVELPRNPQLTVEVLNGKQYRAAVIKRVALFATQSGTLEISPMVVQTTLQVQSARSLDPFDAFFRDALGRTVTYPVKSEKITIKVDPLPPNAPEDFRGAVGQFAMSTSVDKKTTRTNEPISFKITISGTGNIKLMEAPTVDLPPDFEQYSPKVSENISRQGERVSGSKTFEHLLLPRYPGLKVIKPVTFSYYDPVKRDYVRLRSPQLEINVEQGAVPPPAFAAGSREDVRLLTEDIRFIKVGSPSLRREGEVLHTSPGFFALMLLPLAGLVGAYVIARRQSAEMKDQVSFRTRRALKVAQKGLKQAEYLLKEKGGAQGSPSTAQRARFYAEVSRALWKYLGDRLTIPPAEFSVEAAVAELSRRSVEPDLQQALRVLLESCDMVRFAPTATDQAAMQKTYDEAKRIIVEIERTLRQS
jgi:hypothetical protein